MQHISFLKVRYSSIIQKVFLSELKQRFVRAYKMSSHLTKTLCTLFWLSFSLLLGLCWWLCGVLLPTAWNIFKTNFRNRLY
ncbi:hypothetical protein CLV24_105231 [Pontibacter ummariensis]|uniref:Uncharacterized protein n=1 Tax=Pontibacter ummariensis TaxID=1610492 RepID=A0A239DNM8_9BACT|nr:hypothetical protein CLV24_105231 [Pontibacter ummariensis]SNS33362.1 hypothetical protein SAMN06296052_10521 [Pontibacter ummariensis]